MSAYLGMLSSQFQRHFGGGVAVDTVGSLVAIPMGDFQISTGDATITGNRGRLNVDGSAIVHELELSLMGDVAAAAAQGPGGIGTKKNPNCHQHVNAPLEGEVMRA